MTAKFTPEDVRAAYIKHDKRPAQHHFGVYPGDDGELVFDQSGCACGLSVLVAGCKVADGVQLVGRPITGTAEVMFGVDGYAFMRGFDGHQPDTTAAIDPDYMESYQLGRACWEAVKDLVPGGEKEKQS